MRGKWILAGTLAVSGALAMPGTGAERCTMMMSYGPHLMESLQYFFATATEESVAAPTALTALRWSPAPQFDPETVEIRGQIVDLHGFTAADRDRARGLLGGHDRAVVVWWSYDAACRPFIADSEAGFAEPGLENVIAGVLTGPEHWVDGVPLIQVYQSFQTPMPGIRQRGIEREAAAQGVPIPELHEITLTGSELWKLVSKLPFTGPEGWRAKEPLDQATEAIVLEWAEAHPHRWMLPPAYEQVVQARGSRQARFAPAQGPPIQGLYRGAMRFADYEGEFCFSLFEAPLPLGLSSQDLPVDVEDYAADPWEEVAPVLRGYRIAAAAGCGRDDLVLDLPGDQPAWSQLRTVLWIRTDKELELEPGEARAWSAALFPMGLQRAMADSGAEPPPGVNPRGRISDHPAVTSLAVHPSIAALAEVRDARTTARVSLLADGTVRIVDQRGPEPITFAVRATRLWEP